MQPKSLKNKLNIFLVILFTTLPSVAFARVTCTGANIGGFSSAFISQEAAQSWVADSVTFDEYTDVFEIAIESQKTDDNFVTDEVNE